MKTLKGVPPVSKNVPPTTDIVYSGQMIDPSHEPYSYLGVPLENILITYFFFGVPPGDAI